jgi:hypothetical protein
VQIATPPGRREGAFSVRARGAVQVPLVKAFSARYNTAFFSGDIAVYPCFFNEIRKGIR